MIFEWKQIEPGELIAVPTSEIFTAISVVECIEVRSYNIRVKYIASDKMHLVGSSGSCSYSFEYLKITGAKILASEDLILYTHLKYIDVSFFDIIEKAVKNDKR